MLRRIIHKIQNIKEPPLALIQNNRINGHLGEREGFRHDSIREYHITMWFDTAKSSLQGMECDSRFSNPADTI